MDRVPVARTVFAAFHLSREGWNLLECRNPKHTRAVSCFGSGRTGGEGELTPPEDLGGLFCVVRLKWLSVKHLREGANTCWGCKGKCRWRSCGVTQVWELHCMALQTGVSQESWGEGESASSYFETRSTTPQMCLKCGDSSPY